MDYSIKKLCSFIIVGFCLGVANIIPGVSGGTFLLIFGIYERTIRAIGGSVSFLKDIFLFLKGLILPNKEKDFRALKASFLNSDLLFLSLIIAGAVFSIIVLSSLMKFLIQNHYALTYAFFAGLIVTSVPLPFKMIKKLTPVMILIALAGVIVTLYVSSSVNPADKVLKKSVIYQERLENNRPADSASESSSVRLAGVYSLKDYFYVAFCGAVAISAMVLPGISGSLVLILMGEYFIIINAISSLKTLQLDYFIFLAILAAGMGGGIIVFARLVEYFFKRYHDSTLSFLGGLMIGSVYALWPFKKYLIEDVYIKKDGLIFFCKDMAVMTNINILPVEGKMALSALISFTIGIIFMSLMLRFDKK